MHTRWPKAGCLQHFITFGSSQPAERYAYISVGTCLSFLELLQKVSQSVNADLDRLTGLEARSLRSRFHRVHSSETVTMIWSRPHPGFQCLTCHLHWSLAYRSISPIFVFMFTWYLLVWSVSKHPLFIRTRAMLD